MNNTIIIVRSEGKTHLVQKDGNFVDNINEMCIMGYLEAAELERKVDYNLSKSIVSLKDLLLSNKDISNKLVEQFEIRQ